MGYRGIARQEWCILMVYVLFLHTYCVMGKILPMIIPFSFSAHASAVLHTVSYGIDTCMPLWTGSLLVLVITCGQFGVKPSTHWGQVTHLCIGNLTIIGSDNGLCPGRRQAIISINTGILLICLLGTNFSEILIGILAFSFKKMCLKVSPAKWHPFCLGLNVLIGTNPLKETSVKFEWDCFKELHLKCPQYVGHFVHKTHSISCPYRWHVHSLLLVYFGQHEYVKMVHHHINICHIFINSKYNVSQWFYEKLHLSLAVFSSG